MGKQLLSQLAAVTLTMHDLPHVYPRVMETKKRGSLSSMGKSNPPCFECASVAQRASPLDGVPFVLLRHRSEKLRT